MMAVLLAFGVWFGMSMEHGLEAGSAGKDKHIWVLIVTTHNAIEQSLTILEQFSRIEVEDESGQKWDESVHF